MLSRVMKVLNPWPLQILINGKGLAMNPFQSLYYVSPACFLCLFVPFVSIELPAMQASPDWSFRWESMLSNALTALALNVAVFLLIGKTSALTMNIAGKQQVPRGVADLNTQPAGCRC